MDDKLNLDHHISQKFNEELEALRSNVLKMGGLVNSMVQDAVSAVVNGDAELGRQVVGQDDKANDLEMAIDEECNVILARRQPTASDLRLVLSIVKTITDLERIGDEAEKIAYLAMRLAEQNHNVASLQHLGTQVQSMVCDALDAFARMDTEAAIRVAQEDSKVDQEYETLTRQYITFMMEDTRNIKPVLDALWCARALERIGDHAKNICEYVIYLVHAEDVRHVDLEIMERAVRAAEHKRQA